VNSKIVNGKIVNEPEPVPVPDFDLLVSTYSSGHFQARARARSRRPHSGAQGSLPYCSVDFSLRLCLA